MQVPLVTVPVNRWLIARGKGHAVVHSPHAAQDDGATHAPADDATSAHGSH